MKKLALIVAAGLVASGAMAQTTPAPGTTSTTVYGRLNETIESQTVNGKNQMAFQDNSSRLGFKLNRQIDRDLTAGIVLEAAVNGANGAVSSGTTGTSGATVFAREATLNLAGSWGKVRLGKLAASDAYFNSVDAVSNHNHDTGTSSDALSGFTTIGKFKNAIAYNGSAAGFGYGVSYGLRKNGNTDTDAVGASPLNLVASYDMGPLSTGLSYEKYDQRKAVSVRANYTVGAVSVGGYVESDSGNTTDISAGTGTTGVVTGANGRTIFRVSGMYTMGQSEFHLNVGKAGALTGTNATGATQSTLAYNYKIDKALKVYGFYTTVANDTNGGYSIGASTGGLSAAAGSRSSSIGAGVRYNFNM